MSTEQDLEEAREEAAIDTVNEWCEQRREYAESHADAGNAYSHMPREGDTVDMQDRLLAYCKENDIDVAGLEPDEVLDEVLDGFRMEAGTIHVGYDRAFVLDTYPVGEIEISLEPLGVAPDMVKRIAKRLDAHVSDAGLAYLTSDVVWKAVMDKDVLIERIADMRRAAQPSV